MFRWFSNIIVGGFLLTLVASPCLAGWESQNPLPSVNGIWGAASDDVFAIGESFIWGVYMDVILHYNGRNWSKIYSGEWIYFSGVWGTASDDVFVVGSSGTILHYDGTYWTEMNSGTTENLRGIWGSASDDVFVLGSSGTILHYDGTNWTEMNSGTTQFLYHVWGAASDDVFVVGSSGTILHYDGTDWSKSRASATTEHLRGVWGVASDDVFAVGSAGTILHYDGTDCLHYNGTGWCEMNSGTTEYLRGIWGAANNDVFVVGVSGTILHYDGTSWTEMASGTSNDLFGVWGAASDNVFAVGSAGTILRYDGTNWTEMNSGTTENLNGVWGAASNDVFVVSDSGTILHYDGTDWSEMYSSTPTEVLNGVWGAAHDDVFAGGTVCLHYDGTDWAQMEDCIRRSGANGVWGASGDDVFAVTGGFSGMGPTVIRHYDGTDWTSMKTGTTSFLLGVWGTASNDVFAVGTYGTILHLGPTASDPPECTPILIAAAAAYPNNDPPWASDLGITNNSDEAMTYWMQFLPRDTDNSDVAFTEDMILAANSSVSYVDVWNTFAGVGAGTINVCVSNADAASVTSRIYTTNDEGTVGQSFVGKVGVAPAKMINTGETARLGFLAQNSAFRTNIGFMNVGPNTITIDADFFTADGTSLGAADIDLLPFSNHQWNMAFVNQIGANNVAPGAFVDIWSDTADASFLAYGSVIDNDSDDPMTIWPFDNSQMVGGGGLDCTPIWIAAAASFPYYDPPWASDLGITNLGAETLSYKFQFLPRGDDNPTAAFSDGFTLGGNQAIVYSDIWNVLAGDQGAGAINVCVDNADNAGVVSRIYSTGDNGTYGQSFVGIRGGAPSKIATGEKVRLAYLFENEALRTNVGFMNAGPNAIIVQCEFFDAEGASLGIKGVNLAPFSNTQWNKAFALDPIFVDDIEAGFIDVWTDTPNANFLTYASVVDNGTGDPSTIWPF